jgi:hypothetical protein
MNIHLSQVVLIGILTFFILYIFLLRTVWMDRIIYLVFAAIGILLVIDPDLTSQIARRIGIGRGTDLLIYLFVLASLFYAINVRAQLKRMHDQMTLVVRTLALQQPVYGPVPPHDSTITSKQ